LILSYKKAETKGYTR